MKNKDIPIMLGVGDIPNKVAVGMKNNKMGGFDVMILGINNGDINILDGRLYTTLHFCKMETLDLFIKCLVDTKKLWLQSEAEMVESEEA